MKKDISLLNDNQIQNKIYTLRGVEVMLDRDLANLYGVKPFRLREQVKRNISRFPEDFMFRLTEEETTLMVSQNAIPSKKSLGGALPYAFTEQGVASVSGILTNKIAIEIQIQIIRAFVRMRKTIANNAIIFQRLEKIEQNQLITDTRLDKVFEAIELKNIKPTQGLFFDGQVFDAYVFVADLIKTSKSSIILIDNYIDETILTLLSKRNKDCKALIYTRSISKKLQLDLDKYNAQYPHIGVKTIAKVHDRFLILDKKEIYHIGASLKDLGKKLFAFSKLNIDVATILDKLN